MSAIGQVVQIKMTETKRNPYFLFSVSDNMLLEALGGFVLLNIRMYQIRSTKIYANTISRNIIPQQMNCYII